MTISSIGTGLSGLQGFQRALDISSNNVANTLTNGFQPKQASFNESTPGVTVSARAPATVPGTAASGTGPSGTDLPTELVNQLIYSAGFTASAQVIKTSDQVLGSLINTTA